MKIDVTIFKNCRIKQCWISIGRGDINPDLSNADLKKAASEFKFKVFWKDKGRDGKIVTVNYKLIKREI
jgi:hypothetical protein